MKCAEIELLMADALGGEVSADHSAALQSHVMQCAACRVKYEHAMIALAVMRKPPAPPRVAIERRGDRLTISSSPAIRRFRLKRFAPLLRYAAGLAVAFAGGYGLRGTSGTDSTVMPGALHIVPRATPAAQPQSLQFAMVSAHQRNPHESDLAKCLMALSR